jgi:hypothetical protein
MARRLDYRRITPYVDLKRIAESRRFVNRASGFSSNLEKRNGGQRTEHPAPRSGTPGLLLAVYGGGTGGPKVWGLEGTPF